MHKSTPATKNIPTIPMVSITKLKTFSFIIVFIIYIIPFSAEATPSIPLEGRSGVLCKSDDKITASY